MRFHMNKILYFGLLGAIICSSAHADSRAKFREEVLYGLDLVPVRNGAKIEEPVRGELGYEVYNTTTISKNDGLGVFIPTDMYVRGGVGAGLGFLSGTADVCGAESNISGLVTQMGLGWNLSSYVRTELDFQAKSFSFSDVVDASASARSVGGTLYFDFARRYIRTGDVTKRRNIVPFMGLGFAMGTYEFEGKYGADGTFVAPRGVLGLNVMINDLIGIDLSYQYQLFAGNGFGWGTHNGGADSVSDIIMSFRMNF